MQRPDKTEYNEFYETYVSLVPEAEINSVFQKQLNQVNEIFQTISEEKSNFAYAEGKWTVKELVGHLIDGERMFGYRALRISRGDKTPIEGFEQNIYTENAPFNKYKFADLCREFELVRLSNISLFNHLKDNDWEKMGTASGNPVSVRAIIYIMTGHVRHHVNILRERYL